MPAKLIPWSLPARDKAAQIERGAALLAEMETRRSCRSFSETPLDRGVLEAAMRIAHTAPSGANRKPWRFVAIDDPQIKRRVREAAEVEERTNYERRFPPEWLEALDPIGTDADKHYLEVAPWLVVLFRVDWELLGEKKIKSYYPMESIGIMSGFFIMACHLLGLATLTHTPSPMKFLTEICGRPANEKPILLMPVGYPADDCRVPDIPKKPFEQAVQWNR